MKAIVDVVNLLHTKGTVRHNLDPWNEFSDEELWQVGINLVSFSWKPHVRHKPGSQLYRKYTLNAVSTHSSIL